MELTQLDAFALGTQSLPRRIRDLEHRARRTGIRSRYTTQGQRGGDTNAAGVSRINYPTVTGDPSGDVSTTIHPLPDTMDFSNTYGAPNAPPPISLVRKNRITNGSFEYFQNGDPLPFGWTGSELTVVKPPSIFPMDGQYVARLTQGGLLQQIMVGTEQVPAGSWVLSVWVYSSIASTLTLSLGVSVDPNVYFGAVHRIDAAGASATNVVPAGEWCRFYRSIITSVPTQIQLYFENETLGNIMYLDAVKLEAEAGVQSLLEPTAYVDDERAATTIIRSLRADSITAGTLAVGGSNAGNPVIYVYDNTDQLIASLGAPVGGFRGLNVMGQAGIKVQAGGTIEAGTTTISDTGITIGVTGNSSSDRAYSFKDATGLEYAKLAGTYLAATGGQRRTIGLDCDFNNPFGVSSSINLTTNTDNSSREALVVSGANAGAISAILVQRVDISPGSTLNTAYNRLEAVGVWQEAGALFLGQTDYIKATTTETSQILLQAGGENVDVAKITLTHTTNGTTVSQRSIALSAALVTFNNTPLATGAGTLSGTSTSSASVLQHTHLVEAFSTPGATVDRLIKTGVAGAVTLADLTASVFRIGASALTASASGAIALGAGTISGASTSDTTINGHTHLVDAFSAPSTTANRLIKTGTGGAVTLADLTATVFRIGASALTASTSGNIAIGAGQLSGLSTDDATLNGHTHSILAFSAPGTTADRLIETGPGGVITLADLTATVFRIGASALTVSAAGNIALGAGTLTAATLNAATTASHTHAITTSAVAAASTVIATDSLGEVVAKLKATSTIAHPGWTSASTIMANSWVDFASGSFAGAGYYKDATGRVWLRGVIKNGTINTTMLTLPAGFRPVFQHISLVMSQVAQIRVDVLTTGAVAAQSAPAGSYTYLSLDGINFMTV